MSMFIGIDGCIYVVKVVVGWCFFSNRVNCIVWWIMIGKCRVWVFCNFNMFGSKVFMCGYVWVM